MTERTYEVRTIGVDYLCDKCGDGLMEHTGIMLMSDPPKYPHKCNRCGTVMDFFQKYPTVRWERLPAY
jgi:DNA-directed RNA polymerase subunit RPC12/RpoP